MTNKTALQELIEWLGEIDNSIFALSASPVELKMLGGFKTKVQSLLEKEKNEMAKCFLAGMNRVIKDRPNQPNFEDYFNQTFKQ